MRTCHYCGRANGKGSRELRPYGPNGEDVCAACTFSSPERNEAAKKRFGQMLNKADCVTGAALLTPEGPTPYIGPVPSKECKAR